jgi:hypothetical protein
LKHGLELVYICWVPSLQLNRERRATALLALRKEHYMAL